MLCLVLPVSVVATASIQSTVCCHCSIAAAIDRVAMGAAVVTQQQAALLSPPLHRASQRGFSKEGLWKVNFIHF